MKSDSSPAALPTMSATVSPARRLVLGIDTCGPAGSVALGLLTGQSIEILEQIELEGRRYSAMLVAAIGDLLAHAGILPAELYAMVAVQGPGSFTGVRVGLSAVKGLAEPGQIPVAAVSRLEVLARMNGVSFAALDAHRNEVFLRLGGPGMKSRECLAGRDDLAALDPAGGPVAICEDAASTLLRQAWPVAELVRSGAPTAADAMRLSARLLAAEEFVDLATLDGNYLRRSDAEIFGETGGTRPAKAESR